MRVVMLSNSFPPQVGGIEAHVTGLAQALVAEGHQVRVVTARRNKTERVHDTFAGLNVTRVPQVNLPKTLRSEERRVGKECRL